jgi:hypothetical protein
MRMFRDEVPVFQFRGNAGHVRHKPAVWTDQDALALMRHLLSQ